MKSLLCVNLGVTKLLCPLCLSVATLLSTVLAAPPATLPVDERGIAWAVHNSTSGEYEQMTFKAPLGMGITIQKSNDLTNWSPFAEFYGLNQTITWNLFAHAQNANNGGGGGNGEAPPEPKSTASLTVQTLASGGVLLGWRSLDTEEGVQHVLTGITPAPEWASQAITASETDERYFFIISTGEYQGVLPQNTQLGTLDAAMIADFSANFPALNQEIIDNTAAAQLAPPPLPADPSFKGFYRLALTPLDSDFDGIPDAIELQNNNSSSFSFDSDGDGYSDGAEQDQGTDANDPNDKPKVEALIVTGDAEEGVEVSQKRKIKGLY